MNINSTNLKITSQYHMMGKLFSQINFKNPFITFSNEEQIAKNRAQYFDENGEPITPDGQKGRYIGGGKQWKKIVSVSDKAKTDLAKVVKQDFIKTKGIGIPDGSTRNDVINNYLKTIASDKRSSASWTLQRMAGDYATRLEELVRKNNPNWKPGDVFDTSILDEMDESFGVDFKV